MYVILGKLRIKNPVMVASGTWGEEYLSLADADRIGAVVTKTITLEKKAWQPAPARSGDLFGHVERHRPRK